ncbi:SNF2 family N-terminal domain-containing protein [Microdochium trichocladiopsis]|uniref:SNF2 family N-terminal domain-containing protein n=1 Tax=Microdochium trichocladiopsis TaxID=1682393 RepID=A0A9P9BRE2_9PEZI|nr:SNF2 family N-terminal domain-containing protein [Microdochium trichocladiopsis]KAH7032710.1 SNF2 family N-terminal domain-containing protein [Microdochium trichocladiopsis]
MSLHHILNDDPPYRSNFSSAEPTSYGSFPSLYPDPHIDLDDLFLDTQHQSTYDDGNGLLEIPPDALHQIEVGFEDWATMMHPVANESDDHAESSHPTSVGPSEILEQDMICYGMLYEYDVKLVSTDMQEVTSTLKASADGQQLALDNHLQKFTVMRRTESAVLCFEDGSSFGYLREGQARVLVSIMESCPAVTFEGVARTHLLIERISKISKSPDRFVTVDINVYGPENIAHQIGQELSSNKAYLQQPDHYLKDFQYKNPHVIKFPGIDVTSRRRNEVRQAEKPEAAISGKEDRLQRMLAEVHATLNEVEEPSRTEGDRRLRTQLLPHQERALTFMARRESGEIPDEDRLWRKTAIEGQEKYIHKISKTLASERPTERGGGVLADEMGMGKTLTMIAVIVQTLSEAHRYVVERQSSAHQSGKSNIYSHSTLVVVPSELLINTWTKQINKHVGDDLTYVKYHGAGRLKDAESLSKADVVITTYHTLAVEFKEKRSLLHNIHWFRVVLDEGHMIRRPATIFHKTCYELEARSRWCLTGTPIQNKLDDIGALFVFIRAEPFHSMAQFRSSITLPFERGDDTVKDKLVMLYKSLCISRPRRKAELPEPIERLRELEFTQEERHLYKRTESIMDRTIRQVVGHVEQEKTFGLFQTYLQLRISCNHGTWQKLFSWRRNRLQEMREAIEANRLDAEIRCGGCAQPRPSLDSYKHYPSCGHFLCSDCRKDHAGDHNIDRTDGRCPLCRIQTRSHHHHHHHHREPNQVPEVVPLFGDEEETQPANDHAMQGLQEEEDYFEDSGHSTKMMALMEDVKVDLERTKSIIFSCWTSTLNLVGRHLEKEGVKYLRIDGETPTKKRQDLLDQFDSQTVRVLIMTTGTGAFGLNIMSAQRVFIVESQWNPSVENQAISRAIRIGQTENVLVTRYIMKGTVEEEMMSQQKRKRDAARLGW